MEKVMRIALTGAGGVGKGTLVKAFCKLHPEFFALSSPVKPVASLLPSFGGSYADYEWHDKEVLQYSALCAEINAERTMHENGLPFIAERSVFDFLPYYAEACADVGSVRKYESIVVKHAKDLPYDILAYIPVEFEPCDRMENAWKERDPEKRRKTDEYIQSMLFGIESSTPTCIVTLKGTTEERAAKLSEIVRWKEGKP